MAEQTGIAWCHHTWNPWTGCTRVSPGCDFCYAATFSKRNPTTFGSWEPGAARKRTGPGTWNNLTIFNRKAREAGERRRVFPSMCDPFDNRAPQEWRDDMFERIRACLNLDFLLLTKRPQNIAAMLPPDWGGGYPNVWLGTTCENQVEADRRIPHLLRAPAAIRFLSCEPMLSAIDLTNIKPPEQHRGDPHDWTATWRDNGPGRTWIDWVILGGESGHGARTAHLEWVESLLRQCKAAGVAAFMKQAGSNRGADWPPGITGKGDAPEQWPAHLRVQHFPVAATMEAV